MLRVRPAKRSDFLAAIGDEPRQPWFAMVAVDEADAPVAFGTVCWDEYGRAWGAFDRFGPVSAYVMHRTARMVMGWLVSVGEPALYTTCDERFEGARLWLERLGFEADENGIWMKCLASKS